MTIKITKQLATMEDLAIGTGTIVQERNGVPLTLTKIDFNSRVIRVTSIAAMETYSAPVGYVFSLNAGGRSGTFDVIAGDFSAELAADTLNGVYIGLLDNPTATTKVAKRRITSGISSGMFGAQSGNETLDFAYFFNAATRFAKEEFVLNLNQVTVLLEPGIFYAKSQMFQSAFVKVATLGSVIIKKDFVSSGSVYKISPELGDPSQRPPFLKDQYLGGNIIDGSKGVLTLSGDPSTRLGIGIELGSTVDIGVLQSLSRYRVFGVSAEGFDVGLQINTFNNYIGAFDYCHFELNNKQINFGQAGVNTINSGENFTFLRCVIANGLKGVVWEADGFGTTFDFCSFDYLGYVFEKKRLYSGITVIGGHIESLGFGITDPDDYGAIVLMNTTNPADAGISVSVSFTNTQLLTKPTRLFRGDQRLVISGNIIYSFLPGIATNYNKKFFSSPAVRTNNFKMLMESRGLFPSPVNNLINNALFSEDVAIAPFSANGYTYYSEGIILSLIEDGPQAESKSIKLSSVSDTGYAAIKNVLVFDVLPGDKIHVLSAYKEISVGIPHTQNLPKVTYTARFYTSDDVLISSATDAPQNYGLNGEVVKSEWYYPEFSAAFLIPQDAKKMGVETVFGPGSLLTGQTILISGLYAYKQ